MKFPKELHYTSDHEWVLISEGFAIIGITDFAQRELGDIVFVDVDTEGENLDQEEVFGSVEAVKTVSDLFMPIAGKIAEVNTKLEDNPELINTDPYGEGWIIKVLLPSDECDLNQLLDYQQYEKLVK